jgi:hypothetical protein
VRALRPSLFLALGIALTLGVVPWRTCVPHAEDDVSVQLPGHHAHECDGGHEGHEEGDEAPDHDGCCSDAPVDVGVPWAAVSLAVPAAEIAATRPAAGASRRVADVPTRSLSLLELESVVLLR